MFANQRSIFPARIGPDEVEVEENRKDGLDEPDGPSGDGDSKDPVCMHAPLRKSLAGGSYETHDGTAVV